MKRDPGTENPLLPSSPWPTLSNSCNSCSWCTVTPSGSSTTGPYLPPKAKTTTDAPPPTLLSL
ncbi:hypothetical protein OIDMADRAFT_20568, partial [Oidiodendron maius Zn]